MEWKSPVWSGESPALNKRERQSKQKKDHLEKLAEGTSEKGGHSRLGKKSLEESQEEEEDFINSGTETQGGML